MRERMGCEYRATSIESRVENICSEPDTRYSILDTRKFLRINE